MSSIQINGDTSGSIILQAPSVAGSTTLTLPTTTGTLVTSNAMPTGSVLQVVNATYSTYVAVSSSTYADTGLTASITPSSTSNKILVIVDLNGCSKYSGNTSGSFKLLKNTTDLFVISSYVGYTNSTSPNGVGSVSVTYLDSPSTTSSVSYKVQIASQSNVSYAELNNYTGAFTSTSTITLMEIKG